MASKKMRRQWQYGPVTYISDSVISLAIRIGSFLPSLLTD